MDRQFILHGMTADWCAQLWRQVYDTLFLKLGRLGFYFSNEERAYAEKSNESFNVPMAAETELLDLIDWYERYPHCIRRISLGRSQYMLPPVPDLRNKD